MKGLLLQEEQCQLVREAHLAPVLWAAGGALVPRS